MPTLRRFVLIMTALFLCLGWTPGALAQALNRSAIPPVIIINQVSGDPTDPSLLGRVELFDGGEGEIDLSGLTVAFFDRTSGNVTAAYDLDGLSTDAEGSFTLGSSTLSPPPSLPFDTPLPLATTNAVALLAADADSLPQGTLLDFAGALDALAFGPTEAADRARAAANDFTARTLITPTAALLSAKPADIVAPDAPAAGQCGEPATPIHEIEGNGPAAALSGTVVIEALVTGDFEDTVKGLRGFFVQEEEDDQDTDPATSEGLFVLDNGFGVDVTVGEVVRVRGVVDEFNGLTRLKRVSSVELCSQNNPLTPVSVTLPLPAGTTLEQYEGMLVVIDSPLTVAQTYFLGRYGQMTLAAGPRPFQPTHLYPPDSPSAQATAADNASRLFVLDDGQDIRALGDNPNPVPYLGVPPPVVIRSGDAVTNVVGLLDQGRINSGSGTDLGLGYRLHPIRSPIFTPVNTRSGPPEVGGTLRVASFNVLNYFNGDGEGGGFPTPRGAATPSEFTRQRNKIIAAITALDADVIGLMEIENDGFGPESAIRNLVNGLNIGVPLSKTYTFVSPGPGRLGNDAITVGLLYRPAVVKPIGAPATLASGAFDPTLGEQGGSRQPLVQTFADANGERFTVVVNHFKSKRPSGSPGPDDQDTGNGAGAWNGRRTEAAQELTAWLASDPTASGDPDFLIIGDLNAYAKETPVTAIELAGYVNLLAAINGDMAYSYVFDGQAGYLDHALASESLAPQAMGAADWHINADEPKVIDYEEHFNPPGYYSPDPFRASDHDPVLIGLALTASSTQPITPTEPITPTPTVTVTPMTPVTPTEVVTSTPTVTPTQALTPTETVTPTVTPSQPITPTETVIPTVTPSEPLTPTETVTPTTEVTSTETPTPSQPITPITVTEMLTPTLSLTPTEQSTPTETPTELPTPVETTTPTETSIPAETPTPSLTPTEAIATNTPVTTSEELTSESPLTPTEAATPEPVTPLIVPSETDTPIPPVLFSGPEGKGGFPSCPLTYTVQPGDTLSAIAQRYGLTYGELARANGLPNMNFLRSGQLLCIPNGEEALLQVGTTYTVQRGDTLTSIARQFGVTMRSLAEANGIANTNLIRVGQVLRIPGE